MIGQLPRRIAPLTLRGTPSHDRSFTTQVIDPLSGASQSVRHFFSREGTSLGQLQLFPSKDTSGQHNFFRLVLRRVYANLVGASFKKSAQKIRNRYPGRALLFDQLAEFSDSG